MKICKRETRPRPVLTTPAKGAVGDCTDETMASMCDLNRIIQRYGGNLAELAAWRGSMSFGEQPPDNLEDALERLHDANRICKSLGVETIKDALDRLDPPDPPVNSEISVDSEILANTETPKKEITHEASENQPQNV